MALETVPDLWWPTSVRSYARMRHDPQLAAVLKAYTYPIRRASWALDGSGCRPEVTQLVADDLGLPILGQDEVPSGVKRRKFQWAEHLRLSLLDLTFGHMPFERIYDVSGPQTRIAAVYERMPQTIFQIKIDPIDGDIEEIRQHFTYSEQSPGIKRNALVWYAHEREGANWVGQSLLRPAWAFWLLKHETARVHAISIRRFGTGILEVQAPPGATPGQIAEAQQYASAIRVSETGGAGLPAGFTSNLRGMVGSVPDAVAFIEYLDKQMTRSTLTSLLDLADTTHGSRALGETFMDLFLLALQSIADAHAEQGTDQLSVPLVDWNWGEDEPAPKIVCGDVGAQHEVTANTIQLLLSSGAVSADPALEEYLRREYKLPDRKTPWTPPHQAAPLADPMSALPDGATPDLPADQPTGPDQANVAAGSGGDGAGKVPSAQPGATAAGQPYPGQRYKWSAEDEAARQATETFAVQARVHAEKLLDGKSGFTGKVTLFKAEDMPGVYAFMGWDGSMGVRDDLARNLSSMLGEDPFFTVSHREMRDPQAILHELLHSIGETSDDHAHSKDEYQRRSVAMIEEGFTELGADQHLSEWTQLTGIGARETRMLKSMDGGHLTYSEYADRLASPERISAKDAWGAYGEQTKQAQDWVQAVAKLEGHRTPKDWNNRTGVALRKRMVQLSDEINRQATAGKTGALANQILRIAQIDPNTRVKLYGEPAGETILDYLANRIETEWLYREGGSDPSELVAAAEYVAKHLRIEANQ